jgi:hypothetical protein
MNRTFSLSIGVGWNARVGSSKELASSVACGSASLAQKSLFIWIRRWSYAADEHKLGLKKIASARIGLWPRVADMAM